MGVNWVMRTSPLAPPGAMMNLATVHHGPPVRPHLVSLCCWGGGRNHTKTTGTDPIPIRWPSLDIALDPHPQASHELVPCSTSPLWQRSTSLLLCFSVFNARAKHCQASISFVLSHARGNCHQALICLVSCGRTIKLL